MSRCTCSSTHWRFVLIDTFCRVEALSKMLDDALNAHAQSLRSGRERKNLDALWSAPPSYSGVFVCVCVCVMCVCVCVHVYSCTHVLSYVCVCACACMWFHSGVAEKETTWMRALERLTVVCRCMSLCL
jgi:hypothetical protein